tara:strand:+ start:13824 stop:14534 length:711 start_codon:yes stop_codon:yes gene_type:complete
MNKILLILFCSLFTNSFAQTLQSEKNYIHLYTDSIVYGEKLSYNTGFMVDPHIKLDGTKYKLDEVKFYKTNWAEKANIKLINGDKSKFVPKLIDGNLNLYAKETKRLNSAYSKKTKTFYINKGNSNISKVTYKNLKEAINDNSNCVPILEAYKKVERGNRIVNTTAASLLAIGVALITYHPKYKRLQPYVIGTLFNTSGVLPMALTPTILISYLYRINIRQKKSKLIQEAVNTYND